MPDQLWFTTARLTVHLSREANADGVSLIEHRMSQGFAVPLHAHAGEEESFYVLEGQVRMRVGDEVRDLSAGSAAMVSGGTPHSFRIVSSEARFLTITRGPFEAVVRSLSRPAVGEGLPPQDEPTAEQVDALVQTCAAHGIEFLGPPVD